MASVTPWPKGTPTSDVGPEKSARWPTGIVCWARAADAATKSDSAAAVISFVVADIVFLHAFTFFICAGSSVRIRIELPVRPDLAPPMGEPVGLEAQEQDDHRTHPQFAK